MSTVESIIVKELEILNIKLSTEIYDKLFSYIKQLLEVNQLTNLTAIKDYSEALIKHLYDSLVVLTHPVYQNAEKILDVGSGGGLPGIPLAICSPNKEFVSLEATAKKVNFQKEVCRNLQINNHYAIWGRAEEVAHDKIHRESYDLVIARALAAINTLAELTLPFIRVHSYAIFYKAKGVQEEIISASSTLQILSSQIEQVKTFILPEDAGERNLVFVKKHKATSQKYPRRSGLPQKSPLS